MEELLLGCGSSREKRVGLGRDNETDGEWHKLVTTDINADHHPDVVWDLNEMPWPFEDNRFSEVHAYEVLEHLGQQGDYRAFFAHFSEIWRILEPGGYLCATVPAPDSPWVWGDPSHTRQIAPETLVFLSQAQYEQQVGVTPMSDFRFCYTADFEVAWFHIEPRGTFAFILKAVKA